MDCLLHVIRQPELIFSEVIYMLICTKPGEHHPTFDELPCQQSQRAAIPSINLNSFCNGPTARVGFTKLE